jgi:hypothetical protein
MDNFDFDWWADLYRKDPILFEEERKRAISKVLINASPVNRDKLKAIQLECDAISATHEPLEAAAEMLKMAVDRLYDIQDSLADLAIECDRQFSKDK